MLVNPVTKANIDTYLQNPFQTLILVGHAGSGKKTLINHISKSLFSSLIDEYHHALVIDGATEGIDRVREIKKHLTHAFVPSLPDQKRIVAILNIDRLSRDALVSLLKLIEEPPSHTLIIITANDMKNLPDTILSRAKKIDVLPVDQAITTEYLTAKSVNADESKKIWFKSKGLAGKITQFTELLEDEDTNILARDFITSKPSERLTHVNELSKMDKPIQLEIIKSISSIMYYKFGSSVDNNTSALNDSDKLNKINELTKRLEGNANSKLIWTDLSLSL